MSVVERAIQQLQAPTDTPAITPSRPEAVAAVLVAAISADGTFGLDDANRLQSVLSTSRLFDQAVQAGDAELRPIGMLSIEDLVVRGIETGGIGMPALVDTLRPMYIRVPAVKSGTADNGFTPG